MIKRNFSDMYNEFCKREMSATEWGNECRSGFDKDYESSYMRDSKRRFMEITKGIPSSEKQLRVLDTGTTPFSFFIKECYPHYEVSTIDLSDLLKRRCEARDVIFKKCDLHEGHIPFESDYFDVVIFTEVLEHLLMKPSIILNEIHRILRKGGCLIFSAPNLATIIGRTKLLFGISPQEPIQITVEAKEGWVHGYGHVRLYTMSECIHILEASKFTIRRKCFVQSPPLIKFDKMVVLRLIYGLLCRMIPSTREALYIECVVNK